MIQLKSTNGDWLQLQCAMLLTEKNTRTVELYSFLIDNLFKYTIMYIWIYLNMIEILLKFLKILEIGGMKIPFYKIIGKEQFSNF